MTKQLSHSRKISLLFVPPSTSNSQFFPQNTASEKTKQKLQKQNTFCLLLSYLTFFIQDFKNQLKNKKKKIHEKIPTANPKNNSLCPKKRILLNSTL